MSSNAANSACEKGKQREEVPQEMVHQLLMPDVVSFNAASSACEKGKQLEGALRLLQEKGGTPDVITYNALSVPVKRASSQREPWRCLRQCSSKA